MVKYNLNATFGALADPTRRAILAQLRLGEATVGQLAEPFDMSLVAVSKHLRVLEHAGLITREIRGREHHCRFNGEPLKVAADWTRQYVDLWESRLDALETFVRNKQENNDE